MTNAPAPSAMSVQPASPARWDRVLLAALAAIPLLAALAALRPAGFGYFIDEFYYVACAKRLAFGYVDHPPLAPLLLAAIRAVFGDSLPAMRVAAALALSGTVWVTGLLVRRLGGGCFAALLAGLCVALSPILLAMSSFYSMNAFEPLLWTLIVLTIVRIVQTGQSRWWLAAGALIGVAFQNKHTVAAYVAALGAGVILTRTRRVLLDRWLWAGAAVAIAIALPNIVWQVVNGWPSLEFYRSAHTLKNVSIDPVASMVTQVVVMNPLASPVWIAGLLYLLVARDARDLRFLGVTFVVLMILNVVSQTSRPDRISSAYPALFAAGAIVFERAGRRFGAARPAIVRLAAAAAAIAIAASAAFALPALIPVFTPADTAEYIRARGIAPEAERGKAAPIHQLLADRTGWESFADDVARVYRSLPAADQRAAVLYAPSYGQAGALELLGPSRGLPDRVIGSHNTYWHWSVGRTNTDVLIAVDANPDMLRRLFAEVWEAGRVRCDYCMSWRSDVGIYVARRSIAPIDAVWPRVRHYE